MLLYPSRAPASPTFAETYDAARARSDAAGGLVGATLDLFTFRDNANAEAAGKAEAYERRNRAIFEATGMQLENPMKADPEEERQRLVDIEFGGLDAYTGWRAGREQKWLEAAKKLARERPEHAGIIAADRAIIDDAYAIARGAEAGMDAADEAAERAGVGMPTKLGATLAGGVAGMLRDPIQVSTLFAGGWSNARTVVGRVVQTMLTEAAVNGGVEAGLQLATQDWRKRAGVEHGFIPAVKQVGLAAAFGGAFGGLARGAAETFRLLGKAPPADFLERLEAGDVKPGDGKVLAQALEIPESAPEVRAIERAAEEIELDRAAFGEPPAELPPEAAGRMAAEAVAAIEADIPLVDLQARHERIERLATRHQPVGRRPEKPSSLTQFLAARGLRDDGGELAAMGLTGKFVPGRGALVRKTGWRLDNAREEAAQLGYFDHIYGEPDRATAESTVDDLLRMLRQEAGGDLVYANRQGGVDEWQAYEGRVKAKDEFRRVLGEVETAARALGIDATVDDATLVRAAELVNDETDAADALDRIFDERYRLAVEAADEIEDPFDAADIADIPFFEENTRTGPAAGRVAGEAGVGGEVAGAGGGVARPGEGLPPDGADAGVPPGEVVAPGPAAEPATPQAAEAAAAVLTEASPGPTLSPDEIDLWDAIPSGRDFEGNVTHTTHALLVEDAERDAFYADFIKSCTV